MLWPRKPAPAAPQALLTGLRIIMRPPEAKDAPDWLEVRTKNQDILRKYEPRWTDDALTQDYFRRRTELQHRNWHIDHAYAFLIFKIDGALIGGMNINNVCRAAAQYASLGYWIDKDHEGQGYMSEAMALTIHYAFKNLKLHRINAACLPHNDRSKKILSRAGFTEEGFAKQYLQINGAWEDHILYGLVRPA